MATTCPSESILVRQEADLVATRNKVRQYAKNAGLGLVDETKLITAASELARNMILYAGSGSVFIELITSRMSTGVRVTFEDHGPGIDDLALAMTDGYSTSQGLGLGLPGAKRLVDEFEINTQKGQGTRVIVTKWKR